MRTLCRLVSRTSKQIVNRTHHTHLHWRTWGYDLLLLDPKRLYFAFSWLPHLERHSPIDFRYISQSFCCSSSRLFDKMLRRRPVVAFEKDLIGNNSRSRASIVEWELSVLWEAVNKLLVFVDWIITSLVYCRSCGGKEEGQRWRVCSETMSWKCWKKFCTFFVVTRERRSHWTNEASLGVVEMTHDYDEIAVKKDQKLLFCLVNVFVSWCIVQLARTGIVSRILVWMVRLLASFSWMSLLLSHGYFADNRLGSFFATDISQSSIR